MVNGEWGTMDRLPVFPMPGVGATDPAQNLPFEVEGIDYHETDGTLRVIVMSPSVCVAIDSKTYRFQR